MDNVLDRAQELHIRGVDRVSIDYRRWLGEIALGNNVQNVV